MSAASIGSSVVTRIGGKIGDGACISRAFASVKNPRIERGKRHALLDILFLSVSTVLAGAEGWEAIEEFAKRSYSIKHYNALVLGGRERRPYAHQIQKVQTNGICLIFRALQSERFERVWKLLSGTYKRTVEIPEKVVLFQKRTVY